MTQDPTIAAPAAAAGDAGFATPEPSVGDVVVTRDPGAACYTVCHHPGEPQVQAPSRDAAVRLADGFARAHGVDVWYREGGTFHRLDTFRSRAAGT
jgi:hypothetical protein